MTPRRLQHVGGRWFQQVRDGEWIPVRKRGYRLGCCDCGLVHRHNFRIVENELQMQSFRDVRSTTALRGTHKYAKAAAAVRKRSKRAV